MGKAGKFLKFLAGTAVIGLLGAHFITGYTVEDVLNMKKEERDPTYTPQKDIEEKIHKAVKNREEEVTIVNKEWYQESQVWEQVRKIAHNAVLEEPELFWAEIRTGYNFLGGTKEEQDEKYKDEITFSLSYQDESEVQRKQEEIDKAAQEFLSDLPANLSDWEKAKWVHDKLITWITYEENEEEDNGNLYGALVLRKCVCNGYCMAYEYLMNELEIPCDTIVGYTSELAKEINDSSIYSMMSSHAWNVVTIEENGQKKSFYVDVTWDDRDKKDAQGKDYIVNNWFGVMPEDMEKAERLSNMEGYEGDDAGEFQEDCNYYVRNGYVLQGYQTEAAKNAFQKQIQEGNNVLTLRWTNQEDYEAGFASLIDNGEIHTILQELGVVRETVEYEEKNILDFRNLYMMNIYL